MSIHYGKILFYLNFIYYQRKISKSVYQISHGQSYFKFAICKQIRSAAADLETNAKPDNHRHTFKSLRY
ncbi:hypothetical protein DSL64_26715 [Dyadobacter luteus]|uniref:Uncharacterized protein n=1 Tax=Dyadobacter luteus TaxID=2259619 RepID=A0A3D8Y3M3_9BACT|nr:hypothetical protein DSL64_26715 [Dyadobacter luteus]